MEFKKCQVGSEVYGHLTDQDIHNGVSDYQGMIQSSVDIVRTSIAEYHRPGSAAASRNFAANANDGQKLYNFFRLLAVCHTVVVDIDPKTKEVLYQASSPDELALIQGAKQSGLILQERSQQFMKIQNENSG